ncbi:metallophosphoesterase [Bacillus sp. 03113]|uniref:metallophosphoesterase n=1 Tax=Bacillus sp. 03113 TaxID=2578211 RepID=UPI0011440123|nr:metallophosphoesterase [Bacillus sp. 03113]
MKKISRKKFLKVSLGSILTAFGLSTISYQYSRHIEPNLLDINQFEIKNKRIPKSFHQFKIIQFSDTHLGFQYRLNQLKDLVDTINSLNPDIIFFTGDLMDNPNRYDNPQELIPFLQKLNAPFGKFAVYGNHDHGGYGTEIYKSIIEESGFTLLLNEGKEIKLIDQSHIYVIGIDDAKLGKPDFRKATSNVSKSAFKILLSHAPDLADEAVQYGIHLQLSGHSHGGQIKIPFYGALVKPPYARKYVEGFYSIKSTIPLTLYVNRGLGTTRLPFRFLSVPELTLFTLLSEDD